MKKIVAVTGLVLAGFLSFGASDSQAGDGCYVECHQGYRCIIGYRYETRCVAYRGRFGRCRYRTVCCKVPVYGVVHCDCNGHEGHDHDHGHSHDNDTPRVRVGE